MKIAVASRDGRTVNGHAGKSRRWLIVEAGPDIAPRVVQTVQLERLQVFHHADPDVPHPLDGVDAVIAASCGEGFLIKMERRGIDPRMTREPDVMKAVVDYVADCLSPPKPRPISGLICKVMDRFHT